MGIVGRNIRRGQPDNAGQFAPNTSGATHIPTTSPVTSGQAAATEAHVSPTAQAAWDAYLQRRTQTSIDVDASGETQYDLFVKTCRLAASKGWRGPVPSESMRSTASQWDAAEAATEDAVAWLNENTERNYQINWYTDQLVSRAKEQETFRISYRWNGSLDVDGVITADDAADVINNPRHQVHALEPHTPRITYRTQPGCPECRTNEYVPHFNCQVPGRAGHSPAHCTANACY